MTTNTNADLTVLSKGVVDMLSGYFRQLSIMAQKEKGVQISPEEMANWLNLPIQKSATPPVGVSHVDIPVSAPVQRQSSPGQKILCPYPLSRGKRTGKPCNQTAKYGGYCKRHAVKMKIPTGAPSIPPAGGIPAVAVMPSIRTITGGVTSTPPMPNLPGQPVVAPVVPQIPGMPNGISGRPETNGVTPMPQLNIPRPQPGVMPQIVTTQPATQVVPASVVLRTTETPEGEEEGEEEEEEDEF